MDFKGNFTKISCLYENFPKFALFRTFFKNLLFLGHFFKKFIAFRKFLKIGIIFLENYLIYIFSNISFRINLILYNHKISFLLIHLFILLNKYEIYFFFFFSEKICEKKKSSFVACNNIVYIIREYCCNKPDIHSDFLLLNKGASVCVYVSKG